MKNNSKVAHDYVSSKKIFVSKRFREGGEKKTLKIPEATRVKRLRC